MLFQLVARRLPDTSVAEAKALVRAGAVYMGHLRVRVPSVRVATGEAIPGEDAADLQRVLNASLEDSSDAERRTRAAIAHLETDAIRRLMELEDHG